MCERKPCPFCGSDRTEVLWNTNDKEFVTCQECGAIGPPCPVEDHGSAVVLWNRRVPEIKVAELTSNSVVVMRFPPSNAELPMIESIASSLASDPAFPAFLKERGHEPLLVFVNDGSDLESLNEAEMERHGWIRKNAEELANNATDDRTRNADQA